MLLKHFFNPVFLECRPRLANKEVALILMYHPNNILFVVQTKTAALTAIEPDFFAGHLFPSARMFLHS